MYTITDLDVAVRCAFETDREAVGEALLIIMRTAALDVAITGEICQSCVAKIENIFSEHPDLPEVIQQTQAKSWLETVLSKM